MDFETVDGGIYSIHGEGSYKLSDLLPHIIGKTGTITDAQLELIKGEAVEGALYLTKDEQGEWYINSDVAFYETYMLTVTIAGVKYEIKVTDPQYTTSLNDVLTDLTISGAEWNASTESYTVKPGKSYTVNMTFQESEDTFQFSNNDWMTLNLPEGITFEAGNTFAITVNEAGENFTVTGNQVEAVGGTIRIKLNDQDPNYQKLKDQRAAYESKERAGGKAEDGEGRVPAFMVYHDSLNR